MEQRWCPKRLIIITKEDAEKKARYLVGMVQGTMGLEGQGLPKVELEKLVQKCIIDIMKGNKTMSMAWEITEVDVFMVLEKHGRATDIEDAIVYEALDIMDDDRVEKAALAYTDIDDQCNSALDEIENILIEEKILSQPKHFTAS